MACYDNIVSLGMCPDETASESGLTLLQAAGISPKNLANIATEQYGNGVELALEKKALSLIQFKNDFYGALQSNNVVARISMPIYNTSNIYSDVSMGSYNGERGITLYRDPRIKGNLRKLKITEIDIYSLTTANDVPLTIYDNGYAYDYTVDLVANTLNTVTVNHVVSGTFAKVLLDNDNISVAQSKIVCMTGCNNTMPNDCGYARGWDGAKEVKSEGYGINLRFQCICDYDQIICDLAKSFTGELIWLKWQINIFDEHYKTNRFNNWVTYNRSDIAKMILPDLENKYNEKWNSMMEGLYGILETYRDSCLLCRAPRFVTNI